jgi:hypothetical protein
LFKLFLPRYRHQRPLPLFFRKKGKSNDKKEKIKKSRPKKKKKERKFSVP